MKKNSFIEGTIIATGAIIFVKILGMLYIIPFYATVGIMGGALYAYAYNIYVMFLDMSSAGIPVAISKITSEYNALGMMEAKRRAFSIGKRIIFLMSIFAFLILFIFARFVASLLIGDLVGGNTIEDVTFVLRAISFSVLIIPLLSVSKGFLQGHKFIKPASISQVIEQIVRIAIILIGSYVALNIFNLSLTTAIGIAVFGSFVGGAAALIYIKRKISKNKEELTLDKEYKKDDVSNKEIRNKLIKYAVPFIIISVAASLYHFIDMVLILRTLGHLGFEAEYVELVASGIATYAPKITMIIGSFGLGMNINLIPNIATAFALNKWGDVNAKLNKALQIFLVVAIPMVLGLSLLSTPAWTIFYGYNVTGSAILSVYVFAGLFASLFYIVNAVLIGLNNFKVLYKTYIIALILKVVLNVPLMLLFNHLGVSAFYGVVLATIISYGTSLAYTLSKLKKNQDIKYTETLMVLKRMFLPLIVMIGIVIVLAIVIPYNEQSRFSSIIYTGIISIIGGLAYLIFTYKTKVLGDIFGHNTVKRIIKRLTFGKVSSD